MGLAPYQELEAGQTYRSCGYRLTREAIVDFARAWDPRGMHLGHESASSVAENVIACGAHIFAISCRLFFDLDSSDLVVAGMGGTELRFLKPVCAGDELVQTCEIVSKSEHARNLELAYLDIRFELGNQRGDLVMTMNCRFLVRA